MASGSVQLELSTKQLALYGVEGAAKDLFGYSVGNAASGGQVVRRLPATISVRFSVPQNKSMIARLEFMGQTYRNIPILKTRPTALKAANVQDFNVKLGTRFEQAGKGLCVAELTLKR